MRGKLARIKALRRTTAYRVLRVLAIALVGAELLYVVVVNILLSTGLLADLVSNPSKGRRVSWERAWSVWPGKVHLEGFDLRMQDYNMQFQVSMDEADVDITVHELLSRKLEANETRGHGVRFRFRHKVRDTEGMEERVAAYPPIEGFDDPPLYQGKEPPPIPEDQYDLWTVELADVDVGIEEIWMNEWRYVGSGRAQGAFRLRPARRLRVEPSRLRLEGGRLRFGQSELLAASTEGDVRARVPDFDVRQVAGMEVFRHVSARVELAARVDDLDPLDAFLDGTRLARGGGTLSVNAELDRGVLSPETKISYRSEQVHVATGSLRARGDAHVTIDAGARESETGSVTATLRSRGTTIFSTRERGAEDGGVALTRLEASVESDTARLYEAWKLRGAYVEVPELEAKEIGWVNALRGDAAKWEVDGGPVTGSLRVHVGEGKGPVGRTALEFSDVTFTYGDLVLRVLRGTIRAQTTVDTSADTGTVELDLFELHEAAAGTREDPTEGWWMTMNGEASYEGLPPDAFEAVVHAKCKNGSPILAALGAKEAIPGVVEDLVALEDLQFGVGVVHDPRHTAVRVRYAKSDLADVSGRWSKRGDATTGAFLIGGDVLSVGVDIERSGVGFRLFANESWLQSQVSR